MTDESWRLSLDPFLAGDWDPLGFFLNGILVSFHTELSVLSKFVLSSDFELSKAELTEKGLLLLVTPSSG